MAVTEFWFNALGHECLRVAKAVQNLASRRVSERQGGRPVAVMERDFVSGRLPAEIWELTREEWNATRRPSLVQHARSVLQLRRFHGKG